MQRKLKEACLATKLDRAWTKQRIRSVVSMTVRRTPARLRPAMAWASVGLTTSEIRI